MQCFPTLRCESSESDDSDESYDGKSGEVNLTLTALQSLHGLNETCDSSSYSKNGANPKRLKKLLKSPQCECQCRVPLQPLLAACRTFWGLPKSSQDALLWQLQSQAGPRAKWCIEGPGWKSQCFQCLVIRFSKYF